MATAGNITAVLTLNSSGFQTGLNKSIEAVEKFKTTFTKTITPLSQDLLRLESSLAILDKTLTESVSIVQKFNAEMGSTGKLNSFASAINKIANALKILSSSEIDATNSMNLINNMFKAFQSSLNGIEIKIKGVSTALNGLNQSENSVKSSLSSLKSSFDSSYMSAEKYGMSLRNAYLEEQRQKQNLEMLSREFNQLARAIQQSISPTEQVATATRQYEQALTVTLPKQREMIMNATGVANAEMREAQASERVAVSGDKASVSLDRQTTATNRLRKAMSSLRMIGTMVASMMVWNFAHNLITATRETVNAKSEMEGYFQMLGYTSGQVDHFNSKLDEMIQKFPRINKYNLGETISSIGVEFELTTQEMEKAMPVVSMITSEYLRAGRNVNEASLAVKDILQGEFQRLSRETGVKGDQLKEAGWSGDKNDVMGLLEALDKVGRSRNWDTFVMKANSLNDAVLILQNRFGEWSADMVNVVQPTILSVFNNLMSFGQGLSESLTATWEWLNGGSWEASATQIGLFGGALLTVSQALVQYRTGMGLAQTSQLGLRKQLASLILGLKGQEIAEVGVRNAIMGKILGVKAETIATKGVTSAIRESYMAQKISTIQEQYNTMATGENTLAKKIHSLYTKIDEAETKGLITAKEKETLQEELNTASKELGTIATIEQTGANSGLTASLYLLGTGEMYVAGETTATATAMGVLNGVISLSPVGWFIGVVMALAGAFYVLSGGLDSSWKKMQKFHDAMEDPVSVMEKQYDRLDRLKNKVGETSDEYTKAKKSVDDFYTNLQSAKAQYDKSEEDFESIGTGVDTNIKDVLEKNGVTESDAKKFVAGYGYLSYGKRKYYEADQVLNKQIYDSDSNFAKDYEDIVKKMDVNSDEFKDVSDKLVGNYENLAEHSYIANTTDDWWEWMWNSLYAGMDQFWIDWDKFWVDPQWGDAIDGLSKLLNPVLQGLGFDSIGTKLAEWVGGIGKFFDGKSLMDLLGLDENKDYIGDFAKWLGNEIGSYDWVGAITSSLTGINVIGAILDAILPAPASASDGSSDHPSFMEDVSNIIGFDIESWCNNFMSDPLGTLGITPPNLDLGEMVKSFFSSNSMSITDLLSKLFSVDVSGIYQWVNDNIITPLVDGIKVGVLNTPVLGSVANLLGFGDDAESEASEKGQSVGSGFTTGVQTGIDPLDDVINSALSGLNLDGITSQFNTNAQSITTTASSTATNVSTSFSNMKNNQKTSLDSMALKNKTAFDDMKNKASGSLLNMRDTTSQITSHVGKSFGTMKDNILSASNKLKTGSTNDFNALGSVIRSFYLNIQNPASWSASNNASRVAKNFGSAGIPSRTSPARKPLAGHKAVRRIGGKHGAGINPYTDSSSKTMSIKDLMSMVNVDEKVPIDKFLAMFSGGFGSWDFSANHRSYIKNRAYTWDTAPATIQSIGQVGHGYKVDRWKNGRASFTWDDFMATAQDVFSAIPYKFYYDSEWKGNWVNALLSGATNCSDGSDALIALARVFGFDGYKQHTTLKNGVGHFFAVINGRKMDTTNFQNHGSWSPLGGAGIPTRTASHTGYAGETQGKTVNITVSMDNATIYGVEDLDNRIQESVQKGLQQEFNDPYTVAI